MRDVSANAPATHILKTGVWDAPLDEVQPGFLTLLAPGPAKITPGNGSTGRRSALANWLTDPANPLPARVMVNRLWHWHFGEGIVGTPSDLGIMGQRPSHPELLDWLASEFVSTGWDIKRMHRLMVTSNTYRQSSDFNELAAKADSRDRLLWRFPRQRLEAEVIRDASLAVSGILNSNVGGPSVMPELPDGMLAPRGGWKLSTPVYPPMATNAARYSFAATRVTRCFRPSTCRIRTNLADAGTQQLQRLRRCRCSMARSRWIGRRRSPVA